jgi:hypothetical protein
LACMCVAPEEEGSSCIQPSVERHIKSES